MTATLLPTPTGPYAVGRVRFDLTDHSRPDPFARRRGTLRRLALVAWYPADTGGKVAGPYLPGAWRTTSWMWGLGSGHVRAHAVDDAMPRSSASGFPLVVFSPSANPALCYTALLTELASNGYVVVGISHPYEPMPLTVYRSGWPRVTRLASLGGALARPGTRPYEQDLAERAAIVDVKADDIAFVAAAMSEAGALPVRLRIDPTRWAAIGHSFGGGAAAEVCRHASCAAGVSLDGGLWRSPSEAAVARPFLQLFAEHPEFTAPFGDVVAGGQYADAGYAAQDRATTVAAWQALHESGGRHTALVTGARHTSFCDWPLLPLRSWSPARHALAGAIGPRAWTASSNAIVAFLDQHVGAGRADVDVTLAADSTLRAAAPAELFEARSAPVA
jgi:dienelactone hydrolase